MTLAAVYGVGSTSGFQDMKAFGIVIIVFAGKARNVDLDVVMYGIVRRIGLDQWRDLRQDRGIRAGR